MFKNLFAGLFSNPTHVHTVPVIDEETGEIGSRVVSCADVQAGVHLHVRHTAVPNLQGGYTTTLSQISCPEAEMERQNLRREVASNEQTIAAQEAEIARLQATVDNYQRLIAGAMQIVFRMSPALGMLLSENLSEPTLTDDGTAVKIENVLFTVLIDPFYGEKITVRPVSSTGAGGVLERSFPIVNGRISEYDQTSILGHVDRIRKAVNGADPVQAISLVDATSASNH